MKPVNRIWRIFRCREKGFTLVEMRIVGAILGGWAAGAVPSVGNFGQSGKAQAYEAELHSVQMATMALMVEATSGKIDTPAAAATDNLGEIKSITASGEKTLASYMTGLTDENKVKTGCKYSVTAEGVVTQVKP